MYIRVVRALCVCVYEKEIEKDLVLNHAVLNHAVKTMDATMVDTKSG